MYRPYTPRCTLQQYQYMLRAAYSIQTSNEIYHYGIKRRSGRYPWGSGERPYQSYKQAVKGKTRDDYFKSARTIEKGTTMYRTTTQQGGEQTKGSTYVTYLDTDRDLYKGGHIRIRDRASSAYETKYTLTEDLKIPSREEFKTSLQDAIDKNPKLLKESVNAYLEEWFPEGSWDRIEFSWDDEIGGVSEKKWEKFVNDSYEARKDQPIDEAWGSLAVSLGKANELKDAVIKDLSSKGYNAMVDEAGVGGSGRMVEGVDPLIIFDSSILKVESTNEISKREELKSLNQYEKWRSKAQAGGKWN